MTTLYSVLTFGCHEVSWILVSFSGRLATSSLY